MTGGGGVRKVDGTAQLGPGASTEHLLTANWTTDQVYAPAGIGHYFNSTNVGARDYIGDIAELIVYDRALTVAEERTVGFYLEQKYGLNTSYVDPDLPIVRPLNENRLNMADNVGPTNVTIFGDVQSTGTSATTVSMLYGTNDAGSVVANWDSNLVSGVGVSLGPVTNQLSNLQSGTKYFFRYYATNASGVQVQEGSPGVFVTASTGFLASAVVSNGLVVWFDAATLNLTNNEPVCVWPNLVPNAYAALQNNPAEQPSYSLNGLNGRPAVSFNNAAGGDVLVQDDFGALLGNNAASIYIVARINNNHNYCLYETRANNPALREGIFTRPGTFRTGRVDIQGDPMPIGGDHIFQINSDTANWELLLNGSSIRSFTPAFNTGAGFRNVIGGRPQDALLRLNGFIAETLIYDRVLTTDEEQRVGDYLELKYGLNTAYRHPDEPVIDNSIGASGVTDSDAALNGTLLTVGSPPTAVSVYWGPTDGGTNAAAWSNVLALGVQGEGALSVGISGLSEETTYYYRYAASNAFREVWAPDSAAFTTDLNPTNFTYRFKVQLCGYDRSETLIDFPLAIRLSTNVPGFRYTDFRSVSGGDLRAAGENGTDLLDHEIDMWNTNGESIVWVRVPSLQSPNQCVWLYWGSTNVALPPTSTNGAVWRSGYRGVWHMNGSIGA
ncbi:MAG: DUF2341 domain-containing protein, partial [Verrucomicrobiota bacterium]